MDKKISFGLWGVLLLEFLYIGVFLLNYDLAWMNSEKFGVHDLLLANGRHWQAEDWTRFLDINTIECDPYRLSRPLSNFVEVVDTKWRASLWDFIPPHPALSMQWPFMFILLPWLMYRAFVNMGCSPRVAFTGICVYLGSVGFLGPLVMLFHPAKSLTSFFGVLSMFCFSLNYKKLPARGSGGAYFGGFLSLFMAFMSDETGIYLYFVAFLLFHRMWLQLWRDKHYGPLSGFLILPLAYVLSIKLFLPYLHWLYNGAWPDLSKFNSYPSVKSLFWPNWHYFWQNTQFLLTDNPHLVVNYKQLSAYPLLFGIQIIYVAVALLLIFLFFKAIPKSDPGQKTLLRLIAACVLAMVVYFFFQTFQMSRNFKSWGIWWYGSLFTLVYVFLLVFILQIVSSHYPKFSKWITAIAFIFVLNGLVFGTYHIAALKLQNANRTVYSFLKIFDGTTDTYQFFDFSRTFERSYCKGLYADIYWRQWKGLPESVDPAKKDKCYNGVLLDDLYFLTEENGYLHADLH